VSHRSFKLTAAHKAWVYAASGILFITGCLWWFANQAADRGWPGADFATAKPWLLRAHGAAAMVFLFVWGSLTHVHVRRAWHARINRVTGVVLTAWLTLLTATGYGLYYFGNERLRDWTSVIHQGLGLVSAAILIWHVWQGHRAAARRELE
jgi:hypothetical protein